MYSHHLKYATKMPHIFSPTVNAFLVALFAAQEATLNCFNLLEFKH
jgi:hypothetical protein